MKASLSMRLWFACMAAILWAGIFITGFSAASWLLYLPATGLTVASLIGICPLHIALTRLSGFRRRQVRPVDN